MNPAGRIGWGEPTYGLSLVSGGTLPLPAGRVGRLILVRATPAGEGAAGGVVIYARVPSHDQRADLDRPVARVTPWASEQDLTVRRVVVQVGSGLNGKRAKLRRILSDPDAKVIVVEHRDRLARFGVEPPRGGACGPERPDGGGRSR